MELLVNMLAISISSKTETGLGFMVPAEYLRTLWPLCVASHVLNCLWYPVAWMGGSLGFGGRKPLPFLSVFECPFQMANQNIFPYLLAASDIEEMWKWCFFSPKLFVFLQDTEQVVWNLFHCEISFWQRTTNRQEHSIQSKTDYLKNVTPLFSE